MSYDITTLEALALIVLALIGAWAGLQLPIAANIHDWRHWWKNLEFSKAQPGGDSTPRRKRSLKLNPASAMKSDEEDDTKTHNLVPWLPIPRTFAVIRILLILLEVCAFWNYWTKVFAVEQAFGTHYDNANAPTNAVFEATWIVFGFYIVFQAYAPHLFFEFTHHVRVGWLPAVFQAFVFLTGAATCVLMWYNYWAPGLMGLFLPVFDLYVLYLTSHFAYYRSKQAVRMSPRDILHSVTKVSHEAFNDWGFAGYDRANVNMLSTKANQE